MSTRTLVWTLAVVAAALILVPVVGMLAMGGWATDGGMLSGGMMGGGMAGMHVGGIVWLILTIVVVAALVALLVQGETKA